MMRFPYAFGLPLLAALLSNHPLATAVPNPAVMARSSCPSCVDYATNLVFCQNEWPLQDPDFKNINSKFPGVESLDCPCVGQVADFGVTGLQQMLSCWKCLPGNSVTNPLLYKWIVVCETYRNPDYGPQAALKCWNTDTGCWLG